MAVPEGVPSPSGSDKVEGDEVSPHILGLRQRLH